MCKTDNQHQNTTATSDSISEISVPEDLDGERVDQALVRVIPGYSRSFLTSLLKNGDICLNGCIVKPSVRVHEGDRIQFVLPEKILPDILPENIPLDILYEDRDVLVVNKPKNMVVHPAPGHYTGTLVNAVMYHCGSSLSGINGVLRPGIVHRIDKDTTGSVIICKNDVAHQCIAAQLKDHRIVRRYVAICYGVIAEDELTINGPIGRDPGNRLRMAVVGDETITAQDANGNSQTQLISAASSTNLPTRTLSGKPAITHVKVLKRYRDYTYVECRLETGRTHQIRVHMASMHHPLLGDSLYAGNRKSPYHLEGQCLHAKILGFYHPRTGEYIETIAPLPEYFTHLLEILPE